VRCRVRVRGRVQGARVKGGTRRGCSDVSFRIRFRNQNPDEKMIEGRYGSKDYFLRAPRRTPWTRCVWGDRHKQTAIQLSDEATARVVDQGEARVRACAACLLIINSSRDKRIEQKNKWRRLISSRSAAAGHSRW
jgi:hypothetical protein